MGVTVPKGSRGRPESPPCRLRSGDSPAVTSRNKQKGQYQNSPVHIKQGSFFHHHTSRPTASAIFRISAITSTNAAGVIDCAPSHNACAGSLCTSIITPSAPTAIAARAIGCTIQLLPVEWLGSTITGRWLSFFTAQMADRSSVLRVYVSNVRMPRSHSTTLSLPSAVR